LKKIVLATNNPDKVREIKNIWENIPGIEIVSAGDFKELGETKEDGETLEENALKKANYVSRALNLSAVSDDTGLFVNYLKGRPGIHSARYAGNEASYLDNVDKLLKEMEGAPEENRYAEFRTSVCLVRSGREPLFTKGVVKGKITQSKRGASGFGYDPVFEVKETGKTYAEMSASQKDTMSHRYKAFKKMGDLIKREVAQLG
jgi:XTP/dITP diphosphohydrolase